MQARQQLGSYRLLKALTADALGECYRAGSIGAQGIERVVLLRVFNGRGIDGPAFWQAIADRQPLQSILRSPHLAEGVDLGIDGDTPYVAYEYASGKSLAQLGHQAREKPFPIPVEHGLYVVDRVAQALAAAYETKYQGQRMIHGLLTPGWAWLSTEGEVRLQGIDIAPALRTLPPELLQSPDVRPYLAPEVLAGEEPTAADDVYSLGAILFELLTGTALPEEPDHLQLAIENAVLAAEGTELAPSMRDLLANSLSPRGRRIDGAEKWRMVLAALIDEGDHSPSTFNMAFFLHSLFRGDIERESADLEKEKTAEIPMADIDLDEQPEILADKDSELPPSVLTPPAPEPAGGQVMAGVAQATSDGKSRKTLIALAAVLALAVLAAGGYYWFFMRQPPPPTTASVPATTTQSAAPGATPLASAAGDAVAAADGEAGEMPPGGAEDTDPLDAAEPPPTPDELESQVRNLVAQGVGEMEASLKADYEARLRALREQLEEARAASAEETEPVNTQEVSEPAQPPANPATTAAGESDRTASPAAGQTASRQPGEQQSAAGSSPSTPPAGTQQGGSTPENATTAQQPPPQEPEPEPEVQVGDLVKPGPGVIPPRMTKRPRPVYPAAARRFAMTAVVKLRVLVDENGRAAKVEQVSERARFGFDTAAERAALATQWQPATKNGVRVKLWVDLTIEFRP